MVAIPTPKAEITLADVMEWHKLKEELDRVRSAEMLMRKKICAAMFPAPHEGTNRASADAFMAVPGWDFVLAHKIERKIDPAGLSAMDEALTDAMISVDRLVQRKPELVIREYRALTDEQRRIFDACLIIKPGSPQLSLEARAKKKDAS